MIRVWMAWTRTVARLGLVRILRTIFQFLISGVGPLARPSLCRVRSVDLLLTA